MEGFTPSVLMMIILAVIIGFAVGCFFMKQREKIKEAKKNLNKDLRIESEGMAIIPTEWKTEILCYEFKGKVDDREFLVYINAENGREEDILIITNTPNGTLTM